MERADGTVWFCVCETSETGDGAVLFGEKDVEYYFKRLFLIVSVAALFLLRWFFEGLRRSTCDAQRPEVRLETNQLANCSSNLLERLRRDHLRVQWRGHRASVCYFLDFEEDVERKL